MAISRALEVANLLREFLLPGIAVSVGGATGNGELEVVVRGFEDPEDGMSRVWYIELIGRSGMELDLAIAALRKLGFDLSGSAPLISGTLTQPLTKQQISQKAAKQVRQEKLVEKAHFRAELAAEATAGVEQLREEVERLKQAIEDMALLPQPRGVTGPAGKPGRDGADGSPLQLDEASISDLGDVSDQAPEERNVLTWVNGEWVPAKPKFTSISSMSGGGGGGGSLTVQQRDRGDLAADPSNVIEGVTAMSFDTDSGFEVQELADGTTEAFIKLNSTFNPWLVPGQPTLDATGEEPVEFVAGSGINITTDHTADPKQIIFRATGGGTGGGGGGDVEEAPLDGGYYLRWMGQWIELPTGGGPIENNIDGGNFDTGLSTGGSAQIDGGDFNG